jgi:hypothetical protein
MNQLHAQLSKRPGNGSAGPHPVSARWRRVQRPGAATLRATAGLDRAARLPRLLEGPADFAAWLGALVVVVVGAGSIGMRVVDALARMGVGGIWICDGRRTKRESLITHPILSSEVGRLKATLAAHRAKSLSPAADIRYFAGPFEALPRDALVGADIVAVATDNLAAEVAVAQACLHLGVPAVQASVYGPALIAQVRSAAGGAAGAGPCFACSFGSQEWEELDRGTRYSCDGGSGGAGPASPEPTAVPTVSPAHLCALAADLLVGELLRRRLGTEAVPPGEMLEYCGFTGRTLSTRLERRSDCPLEHGAWKIHTCARDLAALTPRALLRIADCSDAELAAATFRVEGHRFAALSVCDCERHGHVDRFVPDGTPLGPCTRCGQEQEFHPFYTHAEVPGAALANQIDRALTDLGVTAAATLLVRGPRGATLVRTASSVLRPAGAWAAGPGSEAFPARREEGQP